MMSVAGLKSHPRAEVSLQTLREFVEDETTLLDERCFDQWLALFAEDGLYWVPTERGQADGHGQVSIFFDDLTILRTRVARLSHDAIHCQDPPSHCVRVTSNFRLEPSAPEAAAGLAVVTSRFIMLEDRPGAERRVFGGRYRHVLRAGPGGLRIVEKRVDLTNCDQSFPSLTQPF